METSLGNAKRPVFGSMRDLQADNITGKPPPYASRKAYKQVFGSRGDLYNPRASGKLAELRTLSSSVGDLSERKTGRHYVKGESQQKSSDGTSFQYRRSSSWLESTASKEESETQRSSNAKEPQDAGTVVKVEGSSKFQGLDSDTSGDEGTKSPQVVQQVTVTRQTSWEQSFNVGLERLKTSDKRWTSQESIGTASRQYLSPKHRESSDSEEDSPENLTMHRSTPRQYSSLELLINDNEGWKKNRQGGPEKAKLRQSSSLENLDGKVDEHKRDDSNIQPASAKKTHAETPKAPTTSNNQARTQGPGRISSAGKRGNVKDADKKNHQRNYPTTHKEATSTKPNSQATNQGPGESLLASKGDHLEDLDHRDYMAPPKDKPDSQTIDQDPVGNLAALNGGRVEDRRSHLTAPNDSAANKPSAQTALSTLMGERTEGPADRRSYLTDAELWQADVAPSPPPSGWSTLRGDESKSEGRSGSISPSSASTTSSLSSFSPYIPKAKQPAMEDTFGLHTARPIYIHDTPPSSPPPLQSSPDAGRKDMEREDETDEEGNISTLKREVIHLREMKQEIQGHLLKTQALLKEEVQKLGAQLDDERQRGRGERTKKEQKILEMKTEIERLKVELERQVLLRERAEKEQRTKQEMEAEDEKKQKDQEEGSGKEQALLRRKAKEIQELKAEIEQQKQHFTKAQTKLQRRVSDLQEEIRTNMDELSKNRRQLISLRSQLDGRERRVEGREKEVEEREKKVEGKERELEGREKDLERRGMELEFREKRVEGEELDFKERGRELEERERELEGQERELEGREKELEERKELGRRERKLEVREKEVERRAREVERKEKELERQVRELEGRERKLEGRERELEGRERELEGRERELEGRERGLRGSPVPTSPSPRLPFEDHRITRMQMRTSEVAKRRSEAQRPTREPLERQEPRIRGASPQTHEARARGASADGHEASRDLGVMSSWASESSLSRNATDSSTRLLKIRKSYEDLTAAARELPPINRRRSSDANKSVDANRSSPTGRSSWSESNSRLREAQTLYAGAPSHSWDENHQQNIDPRLKTVHAGHMPRESAAQVIQELFTTNKPNLAAQRPYARLPSYSWDVDHHQNMQPRLKTDHVDSVPYESVMRVTQEPGTVSRYDLKPPGSTFSDSKAQTSAFGDPAGGFKPVRGQQETRTQDPTHPAPPVIVQLHAKGTLGLPNLGNTSYINSVMQCLFNIDELRLYFRHLHQRSGGLTEAVAEVFEAIEKGVRVREAMNRLKVVVEGRDKIFSLHPHPPASHLLSALLSWMHADLATHTPPGPLGLSTSVLSSLFHGLRELVVVCPVKSHVLSSVAECFDLLTLTIPGSAQVTLEEMVAARFSPQEIMWNCNHCGAHHPCTHLTKLRHPPEVLAIILARSSRVSGEASDPGRVVFPATGLTLNAHLTHDARSRPEYHLIGVIHQEAPGQFTSFCRSKQGRWRKWRDAELESVRQEEVLQLTQTPVLFYAARH